MAGANQKGKKNSAFRTLVSNVITSWEIGEVKKCGMEEAVGQRTQGDVRDC